MGLLNAALAWSPGVGSAFCVWGCLALVRDTSADNLSTLAIPCVFLGFPVASADCQCPTTPGTPVEVSWFPLPPFPRTLSSPCSRSSGTPTPPGPTCQVTVDLVGVGAGGAATGDTRSGGACSRGAGAGGAGTGGASSGGAGVGGPGTGGARPRGAGAGDPDPIGTPSGDTGSRGASFEAACRRAREEQERLERERQELQQLDLLEQRRRRQQQQPPPPPQPQQLPLERQLFPPVSGLRASCLPSSPRVRPPSPPAFVPLFSPPDACPAVWSPPPVVRHYRSRPCPPSARPLSPVTDLHTTLLCTSLRCSPPPVSVLPSPPPSSLLVSLAPISDYYRAVRPVVLHVLATSVTDPCFSPSSVSALTAAVADFATASRLDYSTRVVPSLPTRPLSIVGGFALGCDVLEDRHYELEYMAAASPTLCAMLLSPEGDPDALDIPTPRTYREAVSGPWASQWKVAMDSKLASWRSTGTYIDAFPPLRANVVDGMWLFKVKRPPGSPPMFKARYVARGFSQHEGVDFFQTFALIPKMTTLRVLLDVAAQRDYELHSLDFSTAFLQGRLHEEIWLLRPPGFTGTFPTGTQWSLRRPVYGLSQSPREWHDTLRSTLRELRFCPSSADPSLFVRAGSTPFFILVYVDDLVFATPDRAALAEVNSELQMRHTCTDLGELQRYLGLQITRDRAARTITLTQSHMVQQVLQRFRFLGPYPGHVGCLMYLMTCTRPDLAYPLRVLSRFVGPGRHRLVHWTATVRVAKYLATTSGMGLVLGGTRPVELTGLYYSSYADDVETQRSTQGYCFSLGAGAMLWRSTWSTSVASSSAKAEI
ncbi:unnamed protein product [Closterium sp. NIES-53]